MTIDNNQRILKVWASGRSQQAVASNYKLGSSTVPSVILGVCKALLQESYKYPNVNILEVCQSASSWTAPCLYPQLPEKNPQKMEMLG